MSRLIHFKCPYDPSIEWKDVCEAIFTGDYLCVIEKVGTNSHLHLQGETVYSQKTVESKQSELINKIHYIRKLDPKKHICRTSHGEVSERGYQYICKEDLVKVVSSRGFTDDDIAALHAASEEHVQELKCGYKRKLDEVDYSGDAEDYHLKLALAFCDYYHEEKRNCPPQAGALVLNYINQKIPRCEKLRLYATKKLCKF